jgi:CubicO group peptidase (beta-lactamase class C family)
MSKTRSARLHDTLAAHVTRGDMPGVVALVSRRGETQVEAIGRQSFEADVPMRRDTIFRIASMTKPITAAATLILVEQCKLRLDDPVDDFLPELSGRRVLKRLEGPVDETVPAKRPISVRDLLTFTFGLGAVMVWPAKHPIQKAMADVGLAPGPGQLDISADDFMRRLGSLPLIHQPGERWLYHTGSDVLGVLIARASGGSFADFLRDHLFEPLGMRDTGFQVPADKIGRLASAYMMDREKNKLTFFDDARNSRWSRPPPFAAGGGGPGVDRRRLSRFLPHDAEQGPTRRRAHPVAACRRVHDVGPAHAGAEAGRRAVLRPWRELGHGRRRGHAAHGSFHDAGALRLGWRLRHVGPSRSGREHGRHPVDPAHDGVAAATPGVHRFLDLGLPIH